MINRKKIIKFLKEKLRLLIYSLAFIFIASGYIYLFIADYTSLNKWNPDTGNALMAFGTLVLAIVAFAQINNQNSEAKNRKNSVNRVFIERIKNWIEVIDRTLEDIKEIKNSENNNEPLSFAEAAVMNATIKTAESGAKVSMSLESQEALKKAQDKILKWFETPSYILLNVLKRTDEYQTLLKESNLLSPGAISKLISLFDYIHIFNAQWDDDTPEKNKTDLILLITPMIKVLCIESFFYLTIENGLKRDNKKFIEKYKNDLNNMHNEILEKNENSTYTEDIHQRIHKFFYDFNIKPKFENDSCIIVKKFISMQ